MRFFYWIAKNDESDMGKKKSQKYKIDHFTGEKRHFSDARTSQTELIWQGGYCDAQTSDRQCIWQGGD